MKGKVFEKKKNNKILLFFAVIAKYSRQANGAANALS